MPACQLAEQWRPGHRDDSGLARSPRFPVIGDAIPRIRNTLGGAASTPRRRTTLIVIQGITSTLALSVFGYLILRRR